MISNKDIKRIKSYHLKKFRDLDNVFVAEGVKLVNDLLLAGLQPELLYGIENQCEKLNFHRIEFIKEKEMERISNLKNPSSVLAVFKRLPTQEQIEQGIVLVLDGVQDPGNLGTIIRSADWFGISQIICSNQAVDLYNPKVIQATMGAIVNVSIKYMDLKLLFEQDSRPVIGAFMEGENAQTFSWPKSAFLLMGNEGNGVGEELLPFITDKITIKGDAKRRAESLNVSVATSILLHSIGRF